MAFIRMRITGTEEFERAYTACQMSLGCIAKRENGELHIAAFDAVDAEIIVDTLLDAGSEYLGNWAL